ncbi:hypothetical protein [Pontibacter populi]|uniref:Uncharacterized protein n=1 Tax=Pontibacter populi TaxID=890055 RepID=A0ABV1RTD7_9BACT
MMYEINTPHESDLPLIIELGLNEFVCETNVETYIGSVDTIEFSIEVFVTCAPAQFWRFVIVCKSNNNRTVIETGSGRFSEYWNVAKLIGQNLVSVTSWEKVKNSL